MAKKERSWNQIGKMIAKKAEKEKTHESCHEYHSSGFFGRALFIIGVLVIMNQLHYLVGISIWWQIVVGVGFSLMTFN
jgi:hypothetical protein